MDFYDKLMSFKAVERLDWQELGEIVHMNAAAMRMAVKRKSLDQFKIDALEKYFDKEQKVPDSLFDSDTKISLDSGIFEREDDMNVLARFFLKYQEELRQDLLMGNILKDYEKRGENNFLKTAIKKLKTNNTEKANWIREYLLSANVETSDS